MSSFVARRALGAGVILSMLGATAWHRHTVAAGIRPPVTLSLSIDAPHYRQFLGDEDCRQQCLALERALTDSVRGLLRTRYAFIDWNLDSAADTIELHWIDRAPPDLPRSRLDFRVRSRRPNAELSSYPVDFESYKDFSPRLASPALWHPDTLRRVWLARLETMFAQPDLLVDVFSRIPINAPVSFGPVGRASVKVRGVDIGAADKTRPSFKVRARVADAVNNTTDDADIILTPCELASDGGYGCGVRQLAYVASTVTGEDLLHLLRRSTLAIQSVRVVELVSRDKPSRFLNGAVLPTAGIP